MCHRRFAGEDLFVVAGVLALAGLGLTVGTDFLVLGIGVLITATLVLLVGGVLQIVAWIRPSGRGQDEPPLDLHSAEDSGRRAGRLGGFLRRHGLWLPLAAVVLVSLLSVGLGNFLPSSDEPPRTREFTVNARQFAYSPERLTVNRGDRVILRLQPRDVSHGIYVDGYDVEAHAAPKTEGVVEFVADDPGTFRFRCSVTCGVLHPFMIGEVEVQPNTPFHGAAAGILLVALGVVGYEWWGRRHDPTG